LIGYGLKRRRVWIRQFFIGLLPSLTGAAAILSLLLNFGLPGLLPPTMLAGIGAGIAVLFQIVWLSTFSRLFAGRFHRKQLENIDDLVFLENQHQKDTWNAVRDLARQYLRKTEGKFSLRSIEEDHEAVKTILDHGTREIREAVNELAAIRPGQWVDDPPGPFLSALAKEMAGQDYLP
jgi:hypothetical protein